MTAPKIAFSIKEAAAAVGVSTDVILRAVKATEPPYIRAKKYGNKWLIKAAALEAWFESLPDA